MTNSNFNPTPASDPAIAQQYTIQDDEQFIRKLQTIRIIYVIMLALGLFPLIIPIVLVTVILPSSGETTPILMGLIVVSIIIVVYVLSISTLLIFKIMQIKDASYFITSKRLYVKTKKNDSYISISKEDVKSIKAKFLSTIYIVLHSDEIVLVRTNKQEYPRILKLLSDTKE